MVGIFRGTVALMAVGGKVDDVSLLEEELVQLSVKSSVVSLKEKPTLVCSMWTKKTYHTDSLRAQLKCIWNT